MNRILICWFSVCMFFLGHLGQANSQVVYPEGVGEIVVMTNRTPVPRLCRPKGGDAHLYVASRTGVLPVFEADGIADFFGYFRHGFFDIYGYFLLDADGKSGPESYGFGNVRSDMGGGYPSNFWLDNNGKKIDLSVGSFGRNFEKGLLLDPSFDGDGLPTLVIKMVEWNCFVEANQNGDVGLKKVGK